MPLTKVSDSRALSETHDRNTNNTQDHIENNNGPSYMVLVTRPACRVHYDRCQCVWWRDQTLRRANRKTHVLSQNDGQEVCECICDGGSVEEDLHWLVNMSN
jgi:hypothetical protein